MEDRYFENEIAKVKISFSNKSKEDKEKVFKDIANACYNLVKYEYSKELSEKVKWKKINFCKKYLKIMQLLYNYCI